MKNQKYWIAVISKEHRLCGVNGNFIQVCFGKQAPLKRINNEDWIIVYSPKLKMEGIKKLQSFTESNPKTVELTKKGIEIIKQADVTVEKFD